MHVKYLNTPQFFGRWYAMYISKRSVERYGLKDCIFAEFAVDEHNPDNYIGVIAA